MMVFTHVHKDLYDNIENNIVYTVHNDASIHQVMQDFRRFLLAVSFQPGSIDQYIEAE